MKHRRIFQALSFCNKSTKYVGRRVEEKIFIAPKCCEMKYEYRLIVRAYVETLRTNDKLLHLVLMSETQFMMSKIRLVFIAKNARIATYV